MTPSLNIVQCVYCDGREFYEGHTQGMDIEILCANPTCRHWFILSPYGQKDSKRIETEWDGKPLGMKDTMPTIRMLANHAWNNLNFAQSVIHSNNGEYTPQAAKLIQKAQEMCNRIVHSDVSELLEKQYL